MNIFQKIFFRNKNAKSIIRDIHDFKSSLDYDTSLDAVSFAAIDRIATAFSGLSLGIYSKQTHEKTIHYLTEVFDEPNLDETHSLFFYQLAKDYYNGNVYLYKYTDENGKITNLFRLNPNAVFVSRNEFNQKQYNYYGKQYDSEKILHIPSRFGYDGKTGKGIFGECSKIFSTANNLDDYTKNSFNSNLGKRLVIDLSEAYPDATLEEQLKIRDKYINNYGGVKNAGKPIVKTNKINFETIDSGANDNRANQLIENKKYTENILAEVFGVPLDYLNGNTTNLENLSTLFITNTLKPLCLAFEEAFTKLLSPYDRETLYIEFDFNSVMKTNIQTKIDAYSKELMYGILTPNEIRRKENLPEIEAGNYSWLPSNIIPLTEDNVKAILGKSKLAISEIKNQTERNEQAATVEGLGSDKI